MKNEEDQLALRQYSLEQALKAHEVNPELSIVEKAEDFYKFLNKRTVVTKVENHDRIHVITKNLPELTESQAKVLRKICGMASHGEEWINGASVARGMGKSQPVTSHHMRSLTDMGYLDRSGNRFFPKYNEHDELFTMPIIKCPTKNASGYKSN